MERFPIITYSEPVKGFEDYSITMFGDLMKDDTELVSSENNTSNKNNPIKCTLVDDNGLRTKKYIHRLVAEHFVPNPDNKKFIFHRNYNKHDNRADNLKWVNAYELIQLGKRKAYLNSVLNEFVKALSSGIISN